MECIETEDNLREALDQLKVHHYEFENLAFEGGGAKMGSYVGAIKVSGKMYTASFNSFECIKIIKVFKSVPA